MTEIWKDVVGYEGLYQVSSLGRVKSLDRYDRVGRFCKGRVLRLALNQKGYVQVSLCNGGCIKSVKYIDWLVYPS